MKRLMLYVKQSKIPELVLQLANTGKKEEKELLNSQNRLLKHVKMSPSLNSSMKMILLLKSVYLGLQQMYMGQMKYPTARKLSRKCAILMQILN